MSDLAFQGSTAFSPTNPPEVLVRVKKPHAPLKGIFSDATVEIRRPGNAG
jgi:dihydroneopterin aldolase